MADLDPDKNAPEPSEQKQPKEEAAGSADDAVRQKRRRRRRRRRRRPSDAMEDLRQEAEKVKTDVSEAKQEKPIFKGRPEIKEKVKKEVQSEPKDKRDEVPKEETILEEPSLIKEPEELPVSPFEIEEEVEPAEEAKVEEIEEGPKSVSVEQSEVEEAEIVTEVKKKPDEIAEKKEREKAKLAADEKISQLHEKKRGFPKILKIGIPVLFFLLALAGVIYGVTRIEWPSSPKVMEESEVTPLTPTEKRQFGFATAMIFGSNTGAKQDMIPLAVRNADYFGTFKEPKISGETGISPAIYFGELRDEGEIVDLFVEYVNNLKVLQNLYAIDVYKMLDQRQDRERALVEYLASLKGANTKSKGMLGSIRSNIDDLSVAFNSLSIAKDRYEADYFVALEELQGEKGDSLLKAFVDVSQKQTALKARVRALEQLVEFYEIALARLGKRILAIEKNSEALIQGIRVVDVPGAGIEIIIDPEN